MTDKKFYKIPSEGKLTGVSAGLAEYFGVDVTLVRVMFVVGVFITDGFLLLVYIVLALAMPSNEDESHTKAVAEEAKKPSDYPRKDAIIDTSPEYNMRNWIGLGVIGLGLWLLIYQFFPQIDLLDLSWDYIWPISLVVIGIVILTRKGE